MQGDGVSFPTVLADELGRSSLMLTEKTQSGSRTDRAEIQVGDEKNCFVPWLSFSARHTWNRD
jgi:hypothetical protein